MRNDKVSEVVDVGDVCLDTKNGLRLTLKDVRYVLDMRMNLISTRKLDDEGYCNTFFKGHLKLTKGSLLVVKGKNSKLYMMQAKFSHDVVNLWRIMIQLSYDISNSVIRVKRV